MSLSKINKSPSFSSLFIFFHFIDRAENDATQGQTWQTIEYCPSNRPKRNMLTGWATAHLQKEVAHPLNKICPKGTVIENL